MVKPKIAAIVPAFNEKSTADGVLSFVKNKPQLVKKAKEIYEMKQDRAKVQN